MSAAYKKLSQEKNLLILEVLLLDERDQLEYPMAGLHSNLLLSREEFVSNLYMPPEKKTKINSEQESLIKSKNKF